VPEAQRHSEKDDSTSCSLLGVSVAIDTQCRLSREQPAGVLSRLFASGLMVVGGRLLPCHAKLHQRWRKAIAVASNRQLQQMFILGHTPVLCAVGIVPAGTAGLLIETMRQSLATEPAIREIVDYFGLSAREAQLLKCLCDGMELAEIAVSFGTSLNTVRTQVKTLLAKTGQRSRQKLLMTIACLPALSGAAL